jgi:hypothetical protein
MPSMPVYFVGKGSQFGVLDAEYTGEDLTVYESAIAALEGADDTSMAELANARHGGKRGALSSQDVNHFQQDWLGAWWEHKHVGELIRQGFLAALKIAVEGADEGRGPLPIEALWVCADEGVFQVYINKGPRQVTVLVFTPPPPDEHAHVPDDQLTANEDIWVVKTIDDHDSRIAPDEIDVLTPEGSFPVVIQRRLKYAPTGASRR